MRLMYVKGKSNNKRHKNQYTEVARYLLPLQQPVMEALETESLMSL